MTQERGVVYNKPRSRVYKSRSSRSTMAYKYNPMNGRLGVAVPHTAYSPEGLKPTVADPPQIIWDRKQKAVSQQRSAMGGDGIFGNLIRNRVYENQKIFQKLDGVPIHLKKGFTDRVSYSFVMALTLVGTCWTCYSLYKLAQPKK